MNENVNALKKRKISVIRNLIILLVLAAYACFFAFSFDYAKKSLHEERVQSSEVLMRKINQTVGIGIDYQWNNLNHLAKMLERIYFPNMDQAKETLVQMREDIDADISRLFYIDDTGLCHVSTGTYFQLPNVEVLEMKEVFYVSGADFKIEIDDTPYMYFIVALETPKYINGINITHLGMSCKMSFIDAYFDTSEYGSDGLAFIVDRNGNKIYTQEKNVTMANMKNLLTPFDSVKFNYGASYNDFASDIFFGRDGCINIEYNNKSYYLVYQSLQSKEWTSIMLISDEYVGSAQEGFMRSIIFITALVVAGGVGVIAFFLIDNSHRKAKYQIEINERLKQAADAEKRASDAKTQFLSSMSHDIRTPMNAIIGMTMLAGKHLEDTEYVKNCLNKVTLASNHLLTLINDVLDISKVESGRMMLNPTVFSLAELANKISGVIHHQIHAKMQSFDIRVHNISNEYVFADELRLQQIYINLLSNAVKYTPEGGRVCVDMKEEISPVEGCSRLVYIVEDNGIGMTPEFMETMYDSFARANMQNVGNIQGTGLGLAICRQMVELMDGKIDCESKLGEGTKFTVTLDLPIAENVTDELVLPPLDVLVVDDDEIFLETAMSILSELGMKPECVTGGAAAIEYAAKHHNAGNDYPIIIIDWNMPEMNGEETVRAIRIKLGDEVSIIVVSAYERTDIEKQAIAAGANGFISKPFFRSTVHREMSEILQIDQIKKASDEEEIPEFSNVKLLVAEDNDLNWEIVKEILAMYDIKTERAENGRKCVDMMNSASDGEYNLILMDIKMPILDGYGATEEIRKSEREYVKNIPIVAMTADAFAEDVERCIKAGMNAHLSKPINVTNLLTIIGNCGGGGTLTNRKSLMTGKIVDLTE